MVDEYFDMDLKKIGYFLGLLIGTATIVTLAYGVIFGFDRWTGEMQPASGLMTTATAAPPARTNTLGPGAGQYFCPRNGAVGLPNFNSAGTPLCPGCGQVMGFRRVPFSNPTLAAAGVPSTQENTPSPGWGQYVCPRNCAAGPPNFNSAGTPLCPGCGQVMGFHRAPFSNPTLAAAGVPSTQKSTLSPSAGQYVCPHNCALGPPNFNSAGIPLCPGCGRVMGFHRALFSNPCGLQTPGGGPQNNNLR